MVKEMGRKLAITCDVFNMLMFFKLLANYDITESSNNSCTFSNNTVEYFNSNTNTFDYAILL